jgi:endonuclease-3
MARRPQANRFVTMNHDPGGKTMPRGNVPRQPSRSGRHEGVRHQKGPIPKKASNRVPSDRAKPKRAETPPAKARAPKNTSPRRTTAPGCDSLAPERVRQIIAELDQLYPGVTCALTHRSAWELLVATILSAQCTDVRVNMVTPVLFEKYPTVEDFAALAPEQLEPDIRSTGFFRNKSKSVVGAARKVVADFGGNVPQTMDELLSLPGVARKTANVVLGTWFKKNEGVVVDTHVTRISRRLELTKQDDARKIEDDLTRIIPRERWTDFSHEVIWHGRKLCVARGPKCADCGLEKLCHAADKTWSTVEIHAGAQP